jgi:tetratricopeptide (TPR) repeat protein
VSTDSAKVIETLHSLIGPMRDDAPALETILELSQKAGDSTHTTEIYELLAHTSVHSGNLEKARDYYLKLTQLEPQNQLHTRNYQQVLAKLGVGVPGTRLITPEEGAVLVEELEATAPFIDQRYPDDIALSVRAALTDAELFVSYNMPAKALGPLLSALPKAPRDLRLNQRLAALHTRAGRFGEAAICCRNLEELYHDAGHPDEASRYKDLAEKYDDRTSTKAVELAPIEALPAESFEPVVEDATRAASAGATGDDAAAAVPASAPSPSGLFFHRPTASAAPVFSDFEVHAEPHAPDSEIDISAEWEGEVSDQPGGAASARQPEEALDAETAQAQAESISETIEELRFYLAHSMPEQARVVFDKLKKLKPGAAQLASVWQEIEAAEAPAPAQQAEPVEEVTVEEAEHDREFSSDRHTAADPAAGEDFFPKMPSRTIVPTPEPARAEYAQASPAAEAPGVLGEFVSDLEASLGDTFLPPAPAARVPEPQPRAVSAPVAATSARAGAAAAPAPALEAQPAAQAPTFTYQPTKKRTLAPEISPAGLKVDAASVDLADMFGELKQELEEDAANTQEDPETHYSLGVAFREMGLLDEAIGELQKVCQAVDRGHDFPQLMQTYTWLAQCFLDKGVPEAAIRWYERALTLPGIDEETRTALNYELAASYEAAGNKTVALNRFMEVYGSNIDYRDVAERIKGLKS